MSVPRANPRLAIFGWPIVMGLFSLAGLVAGLLGDGIYDLLAVAGLVVPVGGIAWSLAKARFGAWDR